MKYPIGGKCLECEHLFKRCLDFVDFDKCNPLGKVDKKGDQLVQCNSFIKCEEHFSNREEFIKIMEVYKNV